MFSFVPEPLDRHESNEVSSLNEVTCTIVFFSFILFFQNFLEKDIWEGDSIFREASSNKCMIDNNNKRKKKMYAPLPSRCRLKGDHERKEILTPGLYI